MKFTTTTSLPQPDFNISHQDFLLLVGSCFTHNVAEKLKDNKFNVVENPNGIIYNPISLANSLKRVINNETYSESELLLFNDKWISFNHHGSYSSLTKEDALNHMNGSLLQANKQLKECKTLFITFGSAWVYEYPDFGVVANCHKIPNKKFQKRLLSVDEIVVEFEKIIEELEGINIVFTVSPVRHVKDGLHENNVSKSTLHLAIDNLVDKYESCSYFPSYELLIDELRDYRFYAADLVHPTEIAINYVWEKFGETYFNEQTESLNEAIQKIKTAVAHRPFNFNSDEHQQFITKQISLMDDLAKKHGFLNFEEEKLRLQRE